MNFELMNLNSSLVQEFAVNEIVKCNDLTERYGLVLTEKQAVELVNTRLYALKGNGRIEFGGGIIDKIIKEFCDSPYMSMYNYEETLHELIEMFYYYKNETSDLISDSELIVYMHKAFDGVCQGSLELLSGRELPKLAESLRYGLSSDYTEEDTSNEYEEDENEEY